MKKISADYIYPGNASPIKNGVVFIAKNGVIDSVLNPDYDTINWENVEKFDGVICPGFVNTHCHLELSYLKGEIAENTKLTGFIKDIVKQRDEFSESQKKESIIAAEHEMIQNGIVAVGDISNGDSTFEIKQQHNIYYHTFIEVFGTNTKVAQQVIDNATHLKAKYLGGNVSIVPHAPYSMSPTLVKKLAKLKEKIISIHNQETASENEMFEFGRGGLLKIMQKFAPEMNNYIASNQSSLQSYLPQYFDTKKILLVHNTFTTKEDVFFAKKSPVDIYWCFCPNANEYIEGTQPDYSLFINENCTIGTDSLASNWSLSILDELKTISKKDSSIPLEKLIKWATYNGAQFLEFNTLGSIEKGKAPGINLISEVINGRITNESSIQKIV